MLEGKGDVAKAFNRKLFGAFCAGVAQGFEHGFGMGKKALEACPQHLAALAEGRGSDRFQRGEAAGHEGRRTRQQLHD